MVISKDKSLQFANILLAKKQKKVDELEKFVSNLVGHEYLKTIPKVVLEAFEHDTLKNYMCIRTSIQVVGNGFNWDYFVIQPSPCTKGSNNAFAPSKTTADRLRKHTENLTKLKKDLKEYKSKLEAAIFSLRTPKRILEVFPELESELGKIDKPQTALINVKEIRSLIK